MKAADNCHHKKQQRCGAECAVDFFCHNCKAFVLISMKIPILQKCKKTSHPSQQSCYVLLVKLLTAICRKCKSMHYTCAFSSTLSTKQRSRMPTGRTNAWACPCISTAARTSDRHSAANSWACLPTRWRSAPGASALPWWISRYGVRCSFLSFSFQSCVLHFIRFMRQHHIF